MAESAYSLADTDCMNASQPTIPKWPKNQDWIGDSLGPEIEVGAGLEPR